MAIKWGRSSEGFCDSKDGKWKITPNYWSCVRPQNFKLTYYGPEGSVVVALSAATQKEAKESAERYLERLKQATQAAGLQQPGVGSSDRGRRGVDRGRARGDEPTKQAKRRAAR